MSQKHLVNFPLTLRRCNRCIGIPVLTEWSGAPGYDPDLREYNCPRCGWRTYIVRRGSSKADIRALAAAAEIKGREIENNRAAYAEKHRSKRSNAGSAGPDRASGRRVKNE